MVPQYLEQLQEIDDLVIAPVADVAPRIGGIGDFPVHPRALDAVGVEAVHGRSIDEPRDHARQERGEAVRQRLPVLEHVAPVALESDPPLALGSSRPDVEEVPRPRRITMPPAERQGQILGCEAAQIGVPRRGTCRHKAVHIGFLWQ